MACSRSVFHEKKPLAAWRGRKGQESRLETYLALCVPADMIQELSAGLRVVLEAAYHGAGGHPSVGLLHPTHRSAHVLAIDRLAL